MLLEGFGFFLGHEEVYPSGTLDPDVSIVAGLRYHFAHLVGEVIVVYAPEDLIRVVDIVDRDHLSPIGPTLPAHQGPGPLRISRDQKGQDDPIPNLLVSCEVPFGQNGLQRREDGPGEVCPGEVGPTEVGPQRLAPQR